MSLLSKLDHESIKISIGRQSGSIMDNASINTQSDSEQILLATIDNDELRESQPQLKIKEEITKKDLTTTKSTSNRTGKTQCSRVVYRNKYERNAPEIRRWWQDLFNVLEEDAALPPEEQLAVLKEMLGFTLLDRLMKICNIRNKQFNEQLRSFSEDDVLDLGRSAHIDGYQSTEGATNKRIVLSNETIGHKQPETGRGLRRGTLENVFEVPKSKMYSDFFKRKPHRAAVWRNLPPLSMSEMNLNQKAEAVTKQIATDFIDWLRDLGGDEELTLSVQSIIEMFEIGFYANSATSLKVNVQEMPSVPRRVAEAKHLPKKARRAVLHREIKKDIKASKKETTYTAFGRHLPTDMQVRPPAENYYRKWRSCDRVPERLSSMAAVWQGITHLKSTKAYCEFLLQRPEVKPPKYLSDCGMMDPKNLQDGEKGEKSDVISFGISYGSR